MTHAIRLALKRPVFSIAVVATLALGIGANTAVFSLIHGVVLRPLPYPDADELYTLFEQDSLAQAQQLPSYPTFLDWHEQADAFRGLAYVRGTALPLERAEWSVQMLAAFVTEEFFPVMQRAALHGRTLTPDDFRSDPNVVVLSHALWRSTFGGDPAVVGREVTAGGTPYTVVGVMPPAFTFPEWGAVGSDGWFPLPALPPADMAALGQRGFHADSRTIARLASDVPLERAQEQMHVVARRLAAQYPDASGRWTRVAFISLTSATVAGAPTRLFMFGGAVALVLLICCANLANLYLAQSAARSHEFAVRAALGAGRGRVLRQLVAESLVLATAGGALGAGLAAFVVSLVRTHAAGHLPRVDEVTMDWRVLAFAAGLTILTGLWFAAVGARRSVTPELARSLGQHGAAVSRAGAWRRLPASLLVGQVLLTTVLLVCATLLGRSFVRLTQVDPGFDPHRLVSMLVNPPSPTYDTPQAAARLYERVAEAARAVPGVERVALANHIPTGGGLPTRAAIGAVPTGSDEETRVLYFTVSAGYFETLGIPLIEGRTFTEGDERSPAGPLIVNRTLARRWGGRSPVGERLGVLKAARTRADFGQPVLGTVVGVVGDVQHFGLATQPPPMVYVPYTHDLWAHINVIARVGVRPEPLLTAVQRAVGQLDPTIPLEGTGLGPVLLASRVRDTFAPQRFNAALVSAFALVALLLAAVGIYGVTSYTIALETREIGIRLALGAEPGRVLRAVIGRVARVTLVGLALGVAAALGLTRLMRSLLFEVQATDAVTYGVVVLVLAAVATLAGYIPARRAASVDPMVALRV